MRHLKSALMIATTVLTVLLATAAQAGGVYLGGGIGSASIEDNASTASGATFDESDSAYKVFGGYRFDVLPIVSLSAEVGYLDFGTPNTANREYQLSGFDYAALAGLGLGPVEVFARLGGIQYDLEKIASGVKSEFDGSAPVYGIGARLNLFSLAVRAEYEEIDIDELDKVRTLWISVLYEF